MSMLSPKKGYNRHHILPCLRYYSKDYGNNIYEEFDEQDCVYLTVGEHNSLHMKLNGNPMDREDVKQHHDEVMRSNLVRTSIGTSISKFRNDPNNIEYDNSNNSDNSQEPFGG